MKLFKIIRCLPLLVAFSSLPSFSETECQTKLVVSDHAKELFAKLYTKNIEQKLVGFIEIFYHDSNDVEDVVQEVLLRTLLSIENLNSEDALLPWMTKIAKNLFIDNFRSKKLRKTRVVDFKSWGENYLSDAKARRLKQLLNLIPQKDPPMGGFLDIDSFDKLPVSIKDRKLINALNGLNIERRSVFLMKFVYGESCKTIAKKLNIPEGTVFSRISTAKYELYLLLKFSDLDPNSDLPI